ncbi:hypothetical protein MOO44_00730 (plasmid) [Nicoliella spurrieriana]|uniref:Uncharacterized protein n=2 Tax=Nicoliella spurrieriana TaxID=2925830 RepID=A0A976RQZ7_9LACO|nr:hypothetical protein MOO44_00730 [Nicoliella spurrieriana]
MIEFIRLGTLKRAYLQLIKKRWPKISTNQLIIRRQLIDTYKLQQDPSRIKNKQIKQIISGSLCITIGIALGGYLISNFYLGFIPLTIMFFEAALIFLASVQTEARDNLIYQQYIRTHLDNDLKIVLMPDQMVQAHSRLRLIIWTTLMVESVLLVGWILLYYIH